MKRSVLAILVGTLAACNGDGEPERDLLLGEHQAAATWSDSANIVYSYSALASYSLCGLTATTVKDGIDQAAAVAYGARDDANDALLTAEAHSNAGDVSVLAQAKSYADTQDLATLAFANSRADTQDATTLAYANAYATDYADSASAGALTAAMQFTTQQIAAAGAPCPSTCGHSVTTVYQRDGNGSCVTQFRVPCAPFGCDAAGVACRDSCEGDHQCSTGARCDAFESGECTLANSTCNDPFTILRANNELVSCAPYECVNGACQQQCVDSSNCTEDYHCTASRCVPD